MSLQVPTIGAAVVFPSSKELAESHNPSSSVLGVLQGEWGITNDISNTPCVGTIGVSTCVALFVWSPLTKHAAVAHLERVNLTHETVDNFFQESGLALCRGLFIHLVGGNKNMLDTQQRVDKITDLLKTKYHCKVFTEYLFKYLYTGVVAKQSIGFACLDACTGKLIVKEKNPPGSLNFSGSPFSAKERFSVMLENLRKKEETASLKKGADNCRIRPFKLEDKSGNINTKSSASLDPAALLSAFHYIVDQVPQPIHNPSSRILGILQGEWGITDAASNTPAIGTPSLGPCVGLFAWNPFYGQAACAHLEHYSLTVEAVEKFFQGSGLLLGRGLQVYLVGGYRNFGNSIEKINAIIPLLETKYHCQVNKKHLFKYQHTLSDIRGIHFASLDARSGELTVKDEEAGGLLNFSGSSISIRERHKNIYKDLKENKDLEQAGKTVFLRKGADSRALKK